MNTKTLLALLSAALIGLSGTALAHEADKGLNGGTLIDVDGHHIEFVPGTDELTFYLSDENEAPLTSEGAKMKAIVQNDGKTNQLDLSPAAPNKLIVKTGAPLASGAKVVVTGTLPDGHTLQGRFVVP